MASQTEIEGIPELVRKLYQIGADVGSKATVGAVREAGKEVLKIAKVKIPKGKVAHKTYQGDLVSPGFASRSLKVVAKKTKAGNYVALIGTKAKAFYAIQFVERGTMRQPAQPWLVPALEAAQEHSVEIIAGYFRKTIERIAKKGST